MVGKGARWLFGAAPLVAVSALPSDSTGAGDSHPDEGRSLRFLPGRTGLAKGYTLPVVPVPEPPAGALPATSAGGSGCPLELRGIVIGEHGDALAILARPAGESVLMRRGEGIRASGGWVALEKLAPDHVVLRQGSHRWRCNLADQLR